MCEHATERLIDEKLGIFINRMLITQTTAFRLFSFVCFIKFSVFLITGVLSGFVLDHNPLSRPFSQDPSLSPCHFPPSYCEMNFSIRTTIFSFKTFCQFDASLLKLKLSHLFNFVIQYDIITFESAQSLNTIKGDREEFGFESEGPVFKSQCRRLFLTLKIFTTQFSMVVYNTVAFGISHKSLRSTIKLKGLGFRFANLKINPHFRVLNF